MYPAIVIIAYNRPISLQRILSSISNADYTTYDNITLCISIDGGGSHYFENCSIANQFRWDKGEKVLITHKENLGLRNHVISCGNLSQEYGSLIMLEEDCYVSRNFYDFACKSLKFYKLDSRIAGISLYSYNCFESIGIPFSPLFDGYDVYFAQIPSSLGQIWTWDQWSSFTNYYIQNPKINSLDKLPEKVKTWPESSWKKYFYKYMVENNLYFVYPQVSFSTNFGDVGTHFLESTQMYQVRLENCVSRQNYKFIDYSNSKNIYDAYFELLPECIQRLGCKIDIDTCIDLHGGKQLELFENKYALSIKLCFKKINSYGISFKPLVLNILLNQEGDFFSYGLKTDFGNLNLDKRFKLIDNIETLSFNLGKVSVVGGKYYKVGYYLLHPLKIIDMFKRKLLKITFN